MKDTFLLAEFARLRKFYGRTCLSDVFGENDLISTQIDSYRDFLQLDVEQDKRENVGLEKLLRSIFSIESNEGNATLEYMGYRINPSKYSPQECKRRGNASYSGALIVKLRLVTWEKKENGREIKSITEQEVYVGDIPLITESGSFVINGVEKVVILQLHRSPGVLYTHDEGKSNPSGRYLYSVVIVPRSGFWLTIEFKASGIIMCKSEKGRKFPLTTLFRALNFSTKQIFETFYDKECCEYHAIGMWRKSFNHLEYRNRMLNFTVFDVVSGEDFLKPGDRISPKVIENCEQRKDRLYCIFPSQSLEGRYFMYDVLDDDGDVLVEAGTRVTVEILAEIEKLKENRCFTLIAVPNPGGGYYIRDTMIADPAKSTEEAVVQAYRILKPGEVMPESGANLLHDMFFSGKYGYDLSDVGRMKMNLTNRTEVPLNVHHLTIEDIIAIVKKLCFFMDNGGTPDDQDNLGNRRVRRVADLFEAQCSSNLTRMRKSILDKMSSVDNIEAFNPYELVNYKFLSLMLFEFFNLSVLCNYMAQTNILSSISEKRRISCLGPGGLTHDNAPGSARDAHRTYYSRICSIETPEGKNIGLINNLALYARVGRHGFLEAPYRKIINGVVTNEVEYLSALEDIDTLIVQATEAVDDNNEFVNPTVECRFNGARVYVNKNVPKYMEIASKQHVSVSASLIPFIENCDAVRALTASNMLRQAVPLMRPQTPLIGTGMEKAVAQSSDMMVKAKESGVVVYVDAVKIIIRRVSEGQKTDFDIYNLNKYLRSNQSTCYNQKPTVKLGDFVVKGSVLADCCTEYGQLALGMNIKVAYMSWYGWNYEDAIIVSERVVRDDYFTSFHIERIECIVRDTRLGPERVTRDIPNVSENLLNHLDEYGVVMPGCVIDTDNMILVGKVTPQPEAPVTPEEKLLRAIFGSKSSDVRDSSLRTSFGVRGVVIGVEIFVKKGADSDDELSIMRCRAINNATREYEEYVRLLEEFVYDELKSILLGQEINKNTKEVITQIALDSLDKEKWFELDVIDDVVASKLDNLKKVLTIKKDKLSADFEARVAQINEDDTLHSEDLKVIKVYVMVKRRLRVGDKMAGRHGNKGVVSIIVPEEDMPIMEDGSKIDIILSPLGIPSRMNIGQIWEVTLGRGLVAFGAKIKSLREKAIASGLKFEDVEKLRDTVINFYLGNIKQEEKEKNLGIGWGIMNDDDSNVNVDSCEVIIDAIKQNERCYSPSSIVKVLKSLSSDSLIRLTKEMGNGIPIATPIFDGVKEHDVDALLKDCGISTSGQVKLRDGKTGEYFEMEITVGVLYMLKLHHLSEEKYHVRATGPHACITQQPLGGKAKGGGQRLGEMEVWALEGYGAAYNLYEMLTIKSDSVDGRNAAFRDICKLMEHIRAMNYCTIMPESSYILLSEMRSLGLHVKLSYDEGFHSRGVTKVKDIEIKKDDVEVKS
ncbi:DNA-directed RNA polymerase subunit beta [Candidatus Fokinia crypta]|uniref:DNA-directed RNA polymerase subunit beta n=1 Tax=Candidatus Fokinia crypta TaxID=1920990 RepID=A0ABZ0UPH8_9RICK|nr:DNA-directed RNA polymerase subunit beta [Candidatus Fokinia cryptica]WPX98033.1 DNA-directed RNA polymerase subunit beta [Candidatus Fokinia cryptica]